MTKQTCLLIGAPVDCGKARRGCLMGPDAYRVAGIGAALEGLGHRVRDRGNLRPRAAAAPAAMPAHVHAPAQVIGWTGALAHAAEAAMEEGLPIFLGVDHALSLGSVAGVAAHGQRHAVGGSRADQRRSAHAHRPDGLGRMLEPFQAAHFEAVRQ